MHELSNYRTRSCRRICVDAACMPCVMRRRHVKGGTRIGKCFFGRACNFSTDQVDEEGNKYTLVHSSIPGISLHVDRVERLNLCAISLRYGLRLSFRFLFVTCRNRLAGLSRLGEQCCCEFPSRLPLYVHACWVFF